MKTPTGPGGQGGHLPGYHWRKEGSVSMEHLIGYLSYMRTAGNLPNSLVQKLVLMVPSLLQALAHSGFRGTKIIKKMHDSDRNILCSFT